MPWHIPKTWELKPQRFISKQFWKLESKMQALAVLIASEASLAGKWPSSAFDLSGLVRICLCPNLLFLKRHQSDGIRAHPYASLDLDYLLTDPISRYSPILGYQGVRIGAYELGDTQCSQ